MHEMAVTAREHQGEPGPSDADLARRVVAGDRIAADRLVRRHLPGIWAFLRRLSGRNDHADDLTQDTMIRILQNLHRYDPRYPMRTWALTIARRLWISDLARNRPRRAASLDDGRAVSNQPPPEHDLHETERRDILHERLDQALSLLSEPQRCAIVLFHQQELSVDEVAAVMQLPTGTVKSHLHRGRAAMRKTLEPDREMFLP